ncbi:MAG: FG-GAP repeat domain-containing protein, partial [Steroidobacteraceae bacterium]
MTTATLDPMLLDDFDGNGRVDLLAPASGVWFVLKWTGSAFSWSSTGTTVDSGATSFNFASADVNGDGLPDLVSLRGNGVLYSGLNTAVGGAVSFAAATPGGAIGFTPGVVTFIRGNNSIASSPVSHMDFDGDGRDDIYVESNTGTIVSGQHVTVQYLSRGSSFVAGNFIVNPGWGGFSWPVAWNDDGCTDLISNDVLRISGCSTAAAATLTVGFAVLVTDWDEDGRTDILGASGGVLQLYRSTGSGVAAPVSTGLAAGTGSWLVLDQNGDGLEDLAFVPNTAGAPLTYGLHNGA